MNNFVPFLNKIDATVAVAISLLTYIFGKHWWAFAFFLFLNVCDYITGCIKSKIKKKTNSSKGLIGILKKMGYWIMILLGFGMSAFFVKIGETIGIDLGFTSLIGSFVLISLIINEFRSNIENLIEAGYKIPKILTKGLEVAEKALEEASDLEELKDKKEE